MTDRSPENVHMLTDAEKRLREWLRDQPNGGEWWMIIKGGFRRSYADGVQDVTERVTLALASGRQGGVSCGGHSVLSDGCYAADVARRVIDAMRPEEGR